MKSARRTKIVATRVDDHEHSKIVSLANRYFKGGVSDFLKSAALSYIPSTSYCYGTKIDPVKAFLVDQLVEIGKKTIDPVEVIVFGSQARGDFSQNSDLDILFVVSDKETSNNMRLASKIGMEELRQKIKEPVDVLVRKKFEIYGEQYQGKALVKNIREDGIVVYEKEIQKAV